MLLLANDQFLTPINNWGFKYSVLPHSLALTLTCTQTTPGSLGSRHLQQSEATERTDMIEISKFCVNRRILSAFYKLAHSGS